MSEDKLRKIDEQIEKLKARKQAVLNREKQQERKNRTRRLIQMGALIEKYFGFSTIEETEALAGIFTADPQKLDELKHLVAERLASGPVSV